MQIQFLQRVRVLIILAITMLYAVNVYAQNLKTNQRINPNTETTQLTQAESQRAATDADLKTSRNTSPYDGVKGLKEDQSKRDAFSKHYINEDGSFTALIGAGPIHYERNGQFLDIDTKIKTNQNASYAYANTENLFESYFGTTSHIGIKNKTQEGELIEFLNTQMYWEVNGQAVNTQNSANNPIRIDGDKAYYDNIYGTISAEFTSLVAKRKLNYIIPNQQALGNVPAGADYLVFTEEVVLPFGWTHSTTEEGILIKNQFGKEIYLYDNPTSTDAANEMMSEQNTVFETLLIGNRLTIKTKVKTEWLLNAQRQFPVMVDPTATVYPNSTNFWTGAAYSDGVKSGLGLIRFGRWGTGANVRGWAKFNITSVPADIQVNNVNVNYYIQGANPNYSPSYGHSLSFSQLLIDPVTASGINIYNTIGIASYQPFQTNAINTIGYKNHTITSTNALTTDFNNQKPLGWFALGFMPNGDFYAGEYLEATGHLVTAQRPYLIVDYSFRLTVSGAYTGASYPNGINVPPVNGPVNITPGTRPGYVCVGWNGGTGNIPATGTTASYNIAGGLTQSSKINWLWVLQPGNPTSVIFHNYGGTEQLTFNNSRIDTTTPVFRLSHGTDPASDYEIQINTNPTFAGGTNWTQTFTGAYPLNTEANFTFNNNFTPTNNTTYYVRARVKGAADVWSAWTTETYSFTYQTPKEIPDWFQTTQAQFLTDALSGVNANASGDVVTIAGGNAIVNGDFETNTTGWTKSSNYSAGYSAVRSTAWASTGTASLQMYHNNPGSTGYFSGDHVSMYQTVDLTGVSTLQMDANYSGAGSVIVQLRVYVAETTQATGTTGTLVHTWVPPSNASNSTININLSSYGFTGNKVVKIVYYVTGQETTYNMRYLSVDNIRTTSLPQGTITSTPIHLASVQGATAYKGITWNQTLGGGNLTLKVQQSANGTSGWADVAGYNNISMTGDGEKTFDLSEMTAYPHIRLVGALDGQNVKMHDWAVEFEKEEEDCPITTWWGSPTGWDNGEPTESLLKKVVFAANYTPVATDDITIYACSVEVLPNVTVVLSSDHNMIVVDEVKVDPTATLTIQNGANLVQINDNAANSGEIRIERTFTFSAERKQYNFIISPVKGQSIKSIYDGAPFVIYHREDKNFFYNAGVGAYDPANPAKGFSIKEAALGNYSNSVDAVMKGEPFNGQASFSLKYTDPPAPGVIPGFNLVGNPYPSNLDLDLLYADNSGKIEPTFQFWDNRGNTVFEQQGSAYDGANYAKYNAVNGTGNGSGEAASGANLPARIPKNLARPGTAFMIRALEDANGKTLDFKNEYRVAANNSPEFFGKNDDGSKNPSRYWLTLTTPNGVQYMTAVVYFWEGSNEFTIDDSESNGSSDDIYTLVGQEQISIHGRAPFVKTDKVPLGVRLFDMGTYVIKLYDKEGIFANGQNIYIRDKKLKTIYNLTQADYKFIEGAGEINDRFEIIYNPNSLTAENASENASKILIEKKDGNIVVTSTEHKITQVEVFALNGRSTFQKSEINNLEFKVPVNRFEKQIIVFVVETETGEVITKKFVNK